MRESTPTTVLLAVTVGLIAALLAMASPASADGDVELVAEIEPLVPADPPVIVAIPLLPPPDIDDFAAPPTLVFDLQVDCEGGTPPVTLWMKNAGVEDVTLEVTNVVGEGGFVLEAGTEEVHEVWYHPIEMDETAVTVSVKDGEQVFADQESIVCLRPNVSFELVADCDVPTAWVELTNHGVLESMAGITVDEGAPNALWVDPGQTVAIDLPHAPDEVLHVEVFAAGEYGFSGPWSYSCPDDAEGAEDPDQPTPGPADDGPEVAQATPTDVEPADVIDRPEPVDSGADVEEIAAPVAIPVTGGGSGAGVGVALVVGLGLVALVVASGVALMRSRI